MKSSASFNLEQSKYAITQTEKGIKVNAQLIGTKLVSARRQCAMYVNDVIGIPGYFSDLFVEKQKRITSQVPRPGSVGLCKIALPYGHVFEFEEVLGNDRYTISESNYDDKENFRRITCTMADLKKRGYVGCTDGLDMSVEPPKEEISEWAKASVEKAISKGIATDYTHPQAPLDPHEAAIMCYRLGLLTVNPETATDINDAVLTKEKFTVVLDRLKLL